MKREEFGEIIRHAEQTGRRGNQSLGDQHLRVIRFDEVKERTGLQHSALYKRMARGEFPKPIQLGSGMKARGWLLHEVEAWIKAQIARRDENPPANPYAEARLARWGKKRQAAMADG